MLWNASAFNGFTLKASDGEIGSVSDILFDDTNWAVRWLVVETGSWFSSRKVILPVSVLGHADRAARVFPVNLTMQLVKDSPDIDFDAPVSRQIEERSLTYYGWEPFIGGAFFPMSNAIAVPLLPHEHIDAPLDTKLSRDHGDRHLRSANEVNGYHVHATDGEIGHVSDFLVDDDGWTIRYISVDNHNWWPGKISLILPQSIGGINWSERMMFLKVNRQLVKDAPPYEAKLTVDGAFDAKFLEYYYPN